MLQGKKIILGISGGIAAYKCPELIRALVKEGAEVKVIMTRTAADFVTPQTLSVLSRNEVLSDFFDQGKNWNNHVKLAEWADLMLIAPLTANTLAKIAHGSCDNLLLAVYLSMRSKCMLAPAMDLEMYRHASTMKNLETASSYGNIIIPAESGELASGLSGEGRMAEPENILKAVIAFFHGKLKLSGKKVLVNAGPTYEAIDPVRFIGNRSSGKMGMAIAEAFAACGADVVLVMGPGHLQPASTLIRVIRVESAAEMHQACMQYFEKAEIVICSAAVADYKPEKVSAQKIKKKKEGITLKLVRTTDILKEMGKKKGKRYLVGFALETENLNENAARKLKEKDLDLVVANSAVEKGSGFSGDTNRISLIGKDNKLINFELMSKQKAAEQLVEYISAQIL